MDEIIIEKIQTINSHQLVGLDIRLKVQKIEGKNILLGEISHPDCVLGKYCFRFEILSESFKCFTRMLFLKIDFSLTKFLKANNKIIYKKMEDVKPIPITCISDRHLKNKKEN